ncbi:hypothetical protein [Streptomyces sp. NPDC002580]|uniref:hypothetical protein n=1 Tax=Streptomyces sp. NPDC002580 TaxID=3364653 RepID=UPI0036749E7A
MLTRTAYEDSLLAFWPRVRDYAVPPTMIETATARRRRGDWAGACAAAGFDVDLDLRSSARAYGRELVARIRADLRHLAPDLLRWHLPRVAPDGLLRPGLTLTLARYGDAGRDGGHPVHLVVRTPPAWADGGQRVSLALWAGPHGGARSGTSVDPGARGHPHPRPSRRYRLDLHRHLWDARRTDELRFRSGADRPPDDTGPSGLDPTDLDPSDLDPSGLVPRDLGCAVDRWAAEAGILLRDEGRTTGTVAVRIGSRQRLLLDLAADPAGLEATVPRITRAPDGGGVSALPVLPDAATWVLPDLELLRAGAIEAGRLHPLVASALVPDHVPAASARTPDPAGQPRFVECRGARHRIGLVDGVLAPLDHDPAEIRREELLVALTGTPLPCLRAIDEAHRRPHCLSGVRERLHHGDTTGALAVVEGLLGPDAVLRSGALQDELRAAARRRLAYGLFRAGLTGAVPGRGLQGPERPRSHRSHPRHTTPR